MIKTLEQLTIPRQTYIKFSNGPGSMREVIREPWLKIWRMNEDELGGKRDYWADFELYDERASAHQKTIVNIFIGIKSPCANEE